MQLDSSASRSACSHLCFFPVAYLGHAGVPLSEQGVPFPIPAVLRRVTS